jgi:hypothetical protein
MLSYVTDGGDFYHKLYTGNKARAKRQFKEYAYEEIRKASWRAARDDVLVNALSCVCGGSLSAARELLGDS